MNASNSIIAVVLAALIQNNAGDNALFVCAAISYLFSDATSDALVVEIAQREPLASRCRMQSLIYTTRTTFGGSFSWDIGMIALFVMLAIPCTIMVPVSFLVKDIRQSGVHFGSYVSQFWDPYIQIDVFSVERVSRAKDNLVVKTTKF
ncbi:Aste57867_3047 [Aphanomyces stellatus]|uniref:Aste57867_3047 protein n=1 Tax=Aphanomyces stellatus TaxID=120398 RepID=A0A485KEK9_9STRA|nr:hypothetical protein As57867_003038 [Aphanomyces stellatus]VFT80227.1 Aste57867_3047 [Aphanomyces stellatus]